MGKNTIKKKLQMVVLKVHREDEGTFIKILSPALVNIALFLIVILLLKFGVIDKGSMVYGILKRVIVLILPVLQFLFLWFTYRVSSIVSKSYDIEVQLILPDRFLLEESWIQIASSINHAGKILDSKIKERGVIISPKGRVYLKGIKNENEGLEKIIQIYESINYIKNRMFNGAYMEIGKGFVDISEEEARENEEMSYLWLMELTKSPILERISVLYQIDTEKKQKLFSERDIEELILFFEPFEGFANFIKEERRKREDIKTLKKNKLENKEKNEVDEMFRYGMYRLDKVQEVKIYEKDREFLDVKLDDFK